MTDRRREGRERGWRPVSTLHYDRQEEGGERERGVEACLYITLWQTGGGRGEGEGGGGLSLHYTMTGGGRGEGEGVEACLYITL